METFHHRTRIVLTYITATVLALLLLGSVAQLLMLFFISVLAAILMRDAAEAIDHYTPIPVRPAVILVATVFAAIVVTSLAFSAPRIAPQLVRLFDAIDTELNTLEARVAETSWGEDLLDVLPSSSEGLAGNSARLFAFVEGAISTIFASGFYVVLLYFVAIYLALEPAYYCRIVIRPLPQHLRTPAREMLDEIEVALGWWLVARLSSMAVIGMMTYFGVLALGLPNALGLAVAAGALSFIPNLGPVLSTVPAMIVALPRGTAYIFYVILLYAGLQLVESYIITPHIERRTVSLAAAITILAQLTLSLLVGAVGTLVAAPLVVVVMVSAKHIYFPAVLGEPPGSIDLHIGN